MSRAFSEPGEIMKTLDEHGLAENTIATARLAPRRRAPWWRRDEGDTTGFLPVFYRK